MSRPRDSLRRTKANKWVLCAVFCVRPIRILSIGDEGATADSKEVLAAMMTTDQQLHFDLLVHAGDIRCSFRIYANSLNATRSD